MAHEDGQIYWYDPDPRTIIPLDTFHIPRSLRRTLNKKQFQIRYDANFTAVMEACAAPAPGREQTWIDDNIISAYTALHELGFAHSVEVWQAGNLVGGLYGVSICGLFAGESMFSLKPEASKVALVNLVKHLNKQGFTLLDTQFMTEHLRRFGAIEIPRSEYHRRLNKALQAMARF